MYLEFCNKPELMKQCSNEVESVLQKQSRMNKSGSWNELVDKINFSELNEEELEKPCLQVAMFNYHEAPYRYVEIVDIYVPFCSIVWCGFENVIFQSKTISVWTCMPQM